MQHVVFFLKANFAPPQIPSYFNPCSCLRSHVSSVHLFRLRVHFSNRAHVNKEFLHNNNKKEKHRMNIFMRILQVSRSSLCCFLDGQPHRHKHPFCYFPPKFFFFRSNSAQFLSAQCWCCVLNVLLYVSKSRNYLAAMFVMCRWLFICETCCGLISFF